MRRAREPEPHNEYQNALRAVVVPQCIVSTGSPGAPLSAIRRDVERGRTYRVGTRHFRGKMPTRFLAERTTT